MTDLGGRIAWVICRRCGGEWNALTPTGECVSCVDGDQARARRDQENGAYLRRVLGPWGVAQYSFAGFKSALGTDAAYEACKAFDPAKENLYLFGDCGTGKTHLAGAVLKAMAATGKSIKWVTPIFLGRALRGRFPSEERAFIETLAAHEVLIIDDLGIGRDAYAILQAVYEILEERKIRGLNGLVITTNWDPQKLAEKYDDRLSSRIVGMCRVIQMQGPDCRVEDARGRD